MPAVNKALKKAANNQLAPQHFNSKTDEYEYSQGENGASFVTIKNSVSDVTLQNAITTVGNGNDFVAVDGNCTLTFEVVGTSASRTIVFELAGPSGVYMPHTAFNILEPTKFGTQTIGGSNTAPEIWKVEVPAGFSFRARVSAIAGGNVTIKGKAQSSQPSGITSLSSGGGTSSSGSNVKGAVQNVVTAGSKVQLPAFPSRIVTVIAKDTNVGYIYAGGSDVSSTVYGVKLKPGASYDFEVTNTNLIWIDASLSGEGVSYVAV
ncbi:hypothetical protein [Paenibacillus gallinarum]|uniref:Cyclic nucleotide-binding domain-containing protein n=1 Tax=Paenibacillus gallinarum TaxID=2762232 RepID=A0ABR8SW66_9BACL|nr:hypothetical protein [Paenibacillus gallinarum]MBD7967750.1 hypothetical protein [Paenibacillus gallinarum]